jgi:hypothetical protein
MPKRNYKKKSKKRGGASGILRISRPNSRRSENERQRVRIGQDNLIVEPIRISIPSTPTTRNILSKKSSKNYKKRKHKK